MTTSNCLNCGKELTDKFCAGCGQKADTHRISFKHFLMHDVLHGTFHIDKGIIYTAKQALLRPGQASLEYIAGKRIKYYNVFYLILITIGVMIFFRHVDELLYGDAVDEVSTNAKLNDASQKINAFINQKSKFIIFLFVPLGSINSFILFRRKKLNLSEHAIVSGMILLGILLVQTIINIYFNFNHLLGIDNGVASFVATLLIFGYIAFGYYNAFSANYTKLGITYRIGLFFSLLLLETVSMLYVLIGVITDWKMGQVTIAPF